MSIRSKWIQLGRMPPVRTGLFVLGCLLMLGSPLVGAIPGPGGIIVFGAGLGLVLKYSGWAKRKYVAFKRRYPNKGAWADWGLRRRSAKRRLERERADTEAEGEPCERARPGGEVPTARQALGD